MTHLKKKIESIYNVLSILLISC